MDMLLQTSVLDACESALVLDGTSQCDGIALLHLLARLALQSCEKF